MNLLNKPILLLGANGQLGWQLQRSLATVGPVVSCARTPLPGTSMRSLNIVDTDSLVGAIRALQPVVIVNAAAYTAVDKAESDRDNAFAANAIAPAVMGQEGFKCGLLLIHYSTDYGLMGKKSTLTLKVILPHHKLFMGLAN